MSFFFSLLTNFPSFVFCIVSFFCISLFFQFDLSQQIFLIKKHFFFLSVNAIEILFRTISKSNFHYQCLYGLWFNTAANKSRGKNITFYQLKALSFNVFERNDYHQLEFEHISHGNGNFLILNWFTQLYRSNAPRYNVCAHVRFVI